MFAEIVQVLRKKQYKFLGEIGYGAFGMVYHFKNQNGEDRAVKCVSKQDARNQQEEEFINTALMGSTHPNIITIKEVFREPVNGGDLCIVMEFCDGGNLDQHRYEFNPYQLFQLMRDVLNGLSFMHGKQIVHRDLKPANILLKREAGRIVAKLCDFGVSRLFERDDFMLSMVGTYPYMAPQYEIGRGYDRGVDIWAFGAVFYEIITGENPFVKEGCDKLAIGKNLPVLRELFTKIFTSSQHRITDQELLSAVFSRQLKPEWAREIQQAQYQAKERHHMNHKKHVESNPPEPLEESGIIVQREQRREIVVMRQESPETVNSPARRMPNPVAALPIPNNSVLPLPQIVATHQPIRRADTSAENNHPTLLKPPKVLTPITPRKQDPSSQASDQQQHSDTNQFYAVRKPCKDCNDFMARIKDLIAEVEGLRQYRICAQEEKRQKGVKQFPAGGSAEESAALSKLAQQNQKQKNKISQYDNWVKGARVSYEQLQQEYERLEVRMKEAEPLLKERETLKSQLSECQDLLVNSNRNYWSLVQSWLDQWRQTNKAFDVDLSLKFERDPQPSEQLRKKQCEIEEQRQREKDEWTREKESLQSGIDNLNHEKNQLLKLREQDQSVKEALEQQIRSLQSKLKIETSQMVKGYESRLKEQEARHQKLEQEYNLKAAEVQRISKQLAQVMKKCSDMELEFIKAQEEAETYKGYFEKAAAQKQEKHQTLPTQASEIKGEEPAPVTEQAEKRFRYQIN